MPEVDGWNNGKDFYDLLIRTLPAGAKVLEMGVFFGRGIIYLAEHSEFEIYAVDQFKIKEMPYIETAAIKSDADFYAATLANLFAVDVMRKVTLIALDSERASKLFKDHSLDCVYIDGGHDYESVAQDIALWTPKVKPGGFISGDDYVDPWGVIKAVDEKFPDRIVMGQTWYSRL